MFLLILESLGGAELLFILVIALVFLGPRKLPQLSRSLGKKLSEFRKASEDFKRTWEKEVSLEEFDLTSESSGLPARRPRSYASYDNPEENSILDSETPTQQPQTIEAVTPDQVIARQPAGIDALPSSDNTGLGSSQNDFDDSTAETKPAPKHDWL